LINNLKYYNLLFILKNELEFPKNNTFKIFLSFSIKLCLSPFS
jgi:hypothetical protein